MISGTYERNGKNRKARLNRKYDDVEGRVGNLSHTGSPTPGTGSVSHVPWLRLTDPEEKHRGRDNGR